MATSLPVAPGTAYQHGSDTHEPSTNGRLRLRVRRELNVRVFVFLLFYCACKALEQEILDVRVVCRAIARRGTVLRDLALARTIDLGGSMAYLLVIVACCAVCSVS